MSEIRISHQQIQQSLNNTVAQSQLADQLIDNLRVGQTLTAQLVRLENKYWLVIEGTKLLIPKENIEQWNLQENRSIKLRVKSLAEPIELQIKAPAVNPSRNVNTGKIISVDNPDTKPPTDLSKPTNADKTDADRLVVEVRKYLNKNISQVITRIQTAETKPSDSNSVLNKPPIGKSNRKSSIGTGHTKPLVAGTSLPTFVNSTDAKIKTDVLANNKVSDAIQNLISVSRSAITKPSVVKAEQSVVNSEQTVAKAAPLLTKQGQVVAKTEQPVAKPDQTVIKAEQPLVKPGQTVIKTGQPVVKPEQVKSTNKTIASNSKVVLNKSPNVELKRMKFEIPVKLPDKERFPLLSDKIVAAYNRHLQTQQTSGKSISELFSQLQRLNKWTTDNKTTGRTEAGSQSDKLATDLKSSLKDLFRYISHKDTLKTGKSVEKAIRQSGTFLEKRIKTQQEIQKQQLTKPSAELTIHKDLKANLNRVLATAIYNLAKMNAVPSSTTKPPVAGQSTSIPNTATTQGQQQESTATLNSNLLNNIRAKLKKYTAGKSANVNLPELETITKEVVKNVQSALSRTQLSQLTNLRPESSAQQWMFELPVMNNKEPDVFSIYLKEQPDSEDKISKQRRWSVVLQFDIGSLGKIRTMLSWYENKIQVRFLAEQQNTVELVDTEIGHFQKMLTDQDISFEQLTVEQAQLDDLSFQFSQRADNG